MSSNKVMFKQGAEGRIFKIDYLGKPAILKERFKKNYRLPELDVQLTKDRIRAEAKSILRCQNANIPVPAVYLVDHDSRCIISEFIPNSKTISDVIEETQRCEKPIFLKNVAQRMGCIIGKMHLNGIIHGDLTTSNILFQADDNVGVWKLYLIDFGLSYTKSSDEDKAVDIYVLERALTSKHDEIEWFFDAFLESYVNFDKSCEKVVKKFQEVRSRGRKRTMVG